MLELVPAEAAVLVCMGPVPALDALQAPAGSIGCRVAPDELLVLGPRGLRHELLCELEVELGADPGLVVDQTDGWSLLSVGGSDRDQVLLRLSDIPPGSAAGGFVQGAIARVPGKALIEANSVHLLVRSTAGHHLRDRIASACRDLAPRFRPPAPLRLERPTPMRRVRRVAAWEGD